MYSSITHGNFINICNKNFDLKNKVNDLDCGILWIMLGKNICKPHRLITFNKEWFSS